MVEHIDLIREAKELPHQTRSKIGNRQTVTSTGSADDDSESNTDTDSYPEEQPTYTKLEEIDLLSSIGRDIGLDLEKYVQPVPDVVAMEAVDPLHASSRSSSSSSSMMKDTIEDTNKLMDRDLPEASSADTRKKEKMARNQAKRRQQQQQQQLQQLRAANAQRRPDKRRADADNGPGICFNHGCVVCVCVRARESRDKEDLIFIDQTVDMGGFRKIGMTVTFPENNNTAEKFSSFFNRESSELSKGLIKSFFTKNVIYIDRYCESLRYIGK